MAEQLVDQASAAAPASADDLVAAIQRVLQASNEPLTISKIKDRLPASLRALAVEDTLQRQVSANVLYQYPKYRSPQDRFWDRPMPVHIAWLVKEALAEKALNLAELRRKLPDYAKTQVEAVVQEHVSQKQLHQHPNAGRGGDRFGLRPPDPKDYLPSELALVFNRLEQLGFSQAEIRAGALELLHNEEWAPATVAPKAKRTPPPEGAAPEQATPAPGTREGASG